MTPSQDQKTDNVSTKLMLTAEERAQYMEKIIRFGKYKAEDRSMQWIIDNDPKYFIWITNKMIEDGYGDTNTCRLYVEVIEEKLPLDSSQTCVTVGKYKGKSYKWLLKNKSQYFLWLLKQKQTNKPYEMESRIMQSLLES